METPTEDIQIHTRKRGALLRGESPPADVTVNHEHHFNLKNQQVNRYQAGSDLNPSFMCVDFSEDLFFK